MAGVRSCVAPRRDVVAAGHLLPCRVMQEASAKLIPRDTIDRTAELSMNCSCLLGHDSGHRRRRRGDRKQLHWEGTAASEHGHGGSLAPGANLIDNGQFADQKLDDPHSILRAGRR